ncbi:MAG: serine hydrolase domain-containing protein [Isosphaeraceae bacterium]
MMNRRTFIRTGSAAVWATPVLAAVRADRLDAAAEVLARATADRRVDSAVLHVRRGQDVYARHFGAIPSVDAPFLLGSISKPVTAVALMTLFDRGDFRLDDLARRYLPEFDAGARGRVTVRQLLTHVSGLPDQLPENAALRSGHAPLSEFVKAAVRTPLLFDPGTKYSYSSMAILLASEIARRISGSELPALFDRAVFRPLGMGHSALGLGRMPLEGITRCQSEAAAPESGAGDPSAKSWDWNSAYWRNLGAPWGGVHASAPDVSRLLTEILNGDGKALRPETARRMTRNHNPEGLTPRGLGWGIGAKTGGAGCSEATFGHTGSTGTIAWADPRSKTVCVVLTTLPGAAVTPHPRAIASDLVAKAVS